MLIAFAILVFVVVEGRCEATATVLTRTRIEERVAVSTSEGSTMDIGEPLRTIIVEPLELPVDAPTAEPDFEPEPAKPETEPAPATV
jgi:hypothetical protein